MRSYRIEFDFGLEETKIVFVREAPSISGIISKFHGFHWIFRNLDTYRGTSGWLMNLNLTGHIECKRGHLPDDLA